MTGQPQPGGLSNATAQGQRRSMIIGAAASDEPPRERGLAGEAGPESAARPDERLVWLVELNARFPGGLPAQQRGFAELWEYAQRTGGAAPMVT